jgi:predicted O-methyltransferase YrrM
MTEEQWTIGRLLKVSSSYWESCALHAGVKLEIFSCLGDSELGADHIAVMLNCEVHGITVLLNALAAMGLIIKNQKGLYANSGAAKLLLVKDSEKYIGHILMHHHHLIEAWSRLDEAVAEGGPVIVRKDLNNADRESFLMGMFNMAMGIAPEVAELVSLSGKRRMLDLGGGAGTYAIHFCKVNPDLTATVYDLETTRPFAEKIIALFGFSHRISFQGGNYVEDELDGRYDVIWISHILHGEGPEEAASIIRKAVSLLEENGLLLIHDFILNDNLDGPVFPALFSLNMLVNTVDGRSYSEKQIRDMMTESGLGSIKRLPYKGPNDSGILSANL